MPLYPVPKPAPRVPKTRKPLRRSGRLRVKGRSRFPHRRNPAYRAAVRGLGCYLLGSPIALRSNINDLLQPFGGGFIHYCWGRVQFCHVFDTQGTGGNDVGEGIPLCEALHECLDQRWGPTKFARATGYDVQMEARNIAAFLGYDPACPRPVRESEPK